MSRELSHDISALTPMSSPRLGFRHVLLVLASVTLFAAPPAKPGVRVGFADRDITPDIGMEVPGNYGKVYAKKIHDACKVRASVFDDGQQRVALVGIDALMIRRETVLEIRGLVKAATGTAMAPPMLPAVKKSPRPARLAILSTRVALKVLARTCMALLAVRKTMSRASVIPARCWNMAAQHGPMPN